MPFRPWAPKGSARYKFLAERKDEYLAAKDRAKLEEWYSNLYREYFTLFPWNVPDDVEPENYPQPSASDSAGDDDDDEERIRADAYDRKKKVCACYRGCEIPSLFYIANSRFLLQPFRPSKAT